MTEFSFRTRRQNLERMAREQFDLLVIGGGIHGAGVARDAAMRGLNVALAEKGDYASGTSSKSSKLIHGGLRYLEHFEFGLVSESCRERGLLLRIAPHLVRRRSFLLPIYRDDPRPPWMIRCGLHLYDWLARHHDGMRHRMLSAGEALNEEPELKPEGLRAAAQYWDCQENDARFCLANIVDAASQGALCANYLEVTRFRARAGKLEVAEVRDVISGSRFEIKATAFVNAGGPWVDRIANLDPTPPSVALRPTKGIHLVTRRLTKQHALLLQTRRDRRVFFVLPWSERHSLIGTTDTDFRGEPDHVEAKCRDVEYLLEETNHALPAVQLGESDVLSTFAGLRPLLQQPGRSPSDVTRRHKLVVSPTGLVSIVGGKYTTYRAVAEEVVDLVCRRLATSARSCTTAETMLAEKFPPALLEPGDGEKSRVHAGSGKPDADFVRAIQRAVQHEMAMTVSDVLYRRTQIGYIEPKRDEVARLVAREMAPLLEWSEDETSRQVQAFG